MDTAIAPARLKPVMTAVSLPLVEPAAGSMLLIWGGGK
jgi:hypothetical protein